MNNRYSKSNPKYGDLMTVKEFRGAVAEGWFIDYDGYGNASNGTHVDPDVCIYPSMVDAIPADATHIMWYNR